jgi:hypothetical protein
VTPLGKALSRIAGDLAESKAPFALVGGLAVSARTEPRFTRNADIAVVVDSDEQAEALIYSLKADGYSITALVEQEVLGGCRLVLPLELLAVSPRRGLRPRARI